MKIQKPVEKIRNVFVRDITQDRWGNKRIYLVSGGRCESYRFVGVKGKHKVRIFNPNINDKRLGWEVEII